ncbi:hypothetical protein ACFLWY_01445, partial [Chloroflexota bacterium]
IKCFVWDRRKEELDGRANKQRAIRHCRRYLEEQISVLKPKGIIGLGNAVSQEFGLKKPKHASGPHVISSVGIEYQYVHSMFPGQWTADSWVKERGWAPILQAVYKD